MADKSPTTKPQQTFKPIGNAGNVTYAVVDGAVLLRIAIDAAAVKRATMSKSGKNKLVGTTGGFVYGLADAPGVGISLNVTAKPE